MKYKVGDVVKVKSKEWWDSMPKNIYGSVDCGSDSFTSKMTSMCGKEATIENVEGTKYQIKELGYNWTDEMFEDPTDYNEEDLLL